MPDIASDQSGGSAQVSTPEQQAELKRIESTFYGIPLTDDVVEQIADYTLAELDAVSVGVETNGRDC